MIRQARLFLCALQFLTRIPTPRLADFPTDGIARSAIYYPVVGWIVGAGAALVWLGAGRLWPPLVGAALATLAAVLITGGFHEDGLADAADGLIGGQTAPRRLEIMKDGRIGSYGALAVFSLLAVRMLTVAAMSAPRAALALILAHGAARAFPVLVMMLPYAGDPSRSKLGPAQVRGHEAAIAVVIGLAPFALMPLGHVLLAATLAAVAAGLVALAAHRLIGGWTGDVLGAVEQVAEVGLLLGFSASLTL